MESGKLNELEGFTKSERIGEGSTELASLDFREAVQNEESVFEFLPPEGVQAEFSEPVMVSGASLALAAEQDDLALFCDARDYFPEEPTFQDVINQSKRNSICGQVSFSFCIRLSMSSSAFEDRPNYTYTQSPDFDLNIPCPEESFKDLSIAIADGAPHTLKSTEKVSITAERTVAKVYLTNTPGCAEGGEWQPIKKDAPQWDLEFVDGAATVYAKFQDVFAAESECISDSIGYGSSTGQCFADDPNFLAENIVSGASIGDLAGTADPGVAVCSSDGQTGCIATASHVAEPTASIANAAMLGQTVANVAGTRALPASDCSADGQVDCAANASYPATLLAGLGPKLILGNTAAGIAGSATEESRSNCSSDGHSGCISTSSYRAASVTSLAAKVVTGNTIAGVAGTAVEMHSACSAGGQEDCLTTATYRSMDLSAKDAGGAVDLNNSSFVTHVKTVATMEFWDETGERYTATGDADITEANLLNNAEIFGVTGTAGAPPDCSSIPAGFGTWILVPGDPDYGTNDFCVMKYGATNNSGVPASTATGSPWVSISQQDAKTECASLGKGYHLITNDEWMTIATNVAAQDSNWSGGSVGSGEMARGHSDNSPASACAADANDANAYVEGSCTGSSTGTFNQRRTHTLSNGEVIWDLAGNVHEWISYFNDSAKPSDDGTPDNGAREYTAIANPTPTMPLSDLIPTSALKPFWSDSWNSSQSIGKYDSGTQGSGGALRRGGNWANTTMSGVFMANMYSPPTYATSLAIGFRCTVAVP